MAIRVNNAATKSSVPVLGDGSKILKTVTNGVNTFDPSAVADELWTPKFVIAGSNDGPITSDATLNNDAALVLPVSANATYRMELDLYYQSDAAGDFQISWTGPAGATMPSWGGLVVQAGVLNAGGASAAANWTHYKTTIGATLTMGGTGAAANMTAYIRGWVVTAGTAGNLQLQWCQGTPDANNTTRLAGSSLLLRRVA